MNTRPSSEIASSGVASPERAAAKAGRAGGGGRPVRPGRSGRPGPNGRQGGAAATGEAEAAGPRDETPRTAVANGKLPSSAALALLRAEVGER